MSGVPQEAFAGQEEGILHSVLEDLLEGRVSSTLVHNLAHGKSITPVQVLIGPSVECKSNRVDEVPHNDNNKSKQVGNSSKKRLQCFRIHEATSPSEDTFAGIDAGYAVDKQQV